MLKDIYKKYILYIKSCDSENEAEKVSRVGSPSMLRIVQAPAPRPGLAAAPPRLRAPSRGGSAAAAPLLLILTTALLGAASGADLVIEVPGAGAGHYRLDYRPPHGEPRPNYTVPARASTINFQGQPGTHYHFMLYYSNATLADLLTWNQTIVTAPEPPARLHVLAGKNKQALVTWQPPARGDHSGFRFRVLALTPGAGGAGEFVVGADERAHTLRDLHPGATYQLHAFTALGDKESAAYASTNFTTKPNTPGKFIVWFRNETTLLVLWQPPYPPGAYTHYKVSILPADARDAELYVEKEGEPPGPAQAAFKGLVPGRPYNISVQTVSEPEISAPTTAQYRTVPLRPRDVTAAAGAGWLQVSWRAPAERCEFDRYQVALSGARRVVPAPVPRDAEPTYKFDGLTPGAQYAVSVKTMSGKVTSWPAQLDVTLKPLAVTGAAVSGGADEAPLSLWWAAAAGSLQDSFRVSYRELDAADPHHGELLAPRPPLALDTLLPGRNYSLAVRALSHDAASEPALVRAATRPRAPAALTARADDRALRLSWEPDPASRQDAWRVRWRRVGAEAWAEATRTGTSARAEGLFPGAAYEVRVCAAAGGLAGPERSLTAAAPPLPPARVWVARASSDAALVRWTGPDRAESAVGGFVLRYRTQTDAAWTLLPPLPPDQTEAEVVDMTRGERYTIQLDTASEPAAAGRVESGHPLRADHAVEPPPVTDVAALLDADNLTLEWPRPEGKVEHYEIRWWPQEPDGPPGPARARDLPAADRAHLSASLDGLAPGARYVLAVAAHSAGLVSEELRLAARTRPLCQSELTVVADDAAPDLRAFRVLYTATPRAAATFDRYRVTLRPAAGDGPAREEHTLADAERRVRFDGLEPGRLYNVSLVTLSHNVSSQPVTRQQRPAPGPARALRAEAADARRVLLRWEAPPGRYSDFEVQYAEGAELRTERTTATRLEVGGLRPHTAYTFSVEARAGPEDPRRSAAASASVRTPEAAPGALELSVTSGAPGEATLTWSLPEERRGGEVRRVVVRYWAEGAEAAARQTEFAGLGSGGALSGLAAGRRVEVSAWAETGAGAGPAARAGAWVPVGPPVARAAPAEGARTASTLSLRVSSSLFGAERGAVTAYALVAWQQGAAAPSAWPLLSWQDVQRFPVWPAYQATEPYFPFGSRDDVEITLGTERCERARRLYCNGPLKPATTYHVAVRAFTAPDQFADTARLTLTTEADGTAWAWAGGAGAVALALAAAGAALWRRRARRVEPVPRPSRPVALERFAEHCRLMAADSDFRFSEEFEELKRVGRDQPCTAADLPCNRPKNRFTNVLPYEHSRYKLQPVDDEEGSDYINANYVPGHASPREFIVTQGPLHSTRDDFWRMVWESGARAIVMLTRLVEKGRDKCERYWPADGRPARFGDVSVTVLSESRFPDWAVSELAVSRGPDTRRLPHLHFTTWPDFGVPAPPHTLARFVRAFRDRVEGARPVVVHCSAGVGRSGTFVALDRALQQLAAGAGALDVFGLVAALRSERPHMVQTEQQYIAIHQCVLAALEGQDLRPPPPLSNDNAAYDDDEGIAESGM